MADLLLPTLGANIHDATPSQEIPSPLKKPSLPFQHYKTSGNSRTDQGSFHRLPRSLKLCFWKAVSDQVRSLKRGSVPGAIVPFTQLRSAAAILR